MFIAEHACQWSVYMYYVDYGICNKISKLLLYHLMHVINMEVNSIIIMEVI